MTILNISFSLEQGQSLKFRFWFLKHGREAVAATAPGLCSADLLELVGVPGDPAFREENGPMWSLQLGFRSPEEARAWTEGEGPALLAESYRCRFGTEPLMFMTLLERHPVTEMYNQPR